MTISKIELPDKNWILVEVLICRLENARRSDHVSESQDSTTPEPPFVALDLLMENLCIDKIDAVILTFSLAPLIRPKLGWLYREFQSGDATGFPGIDLICEMLQLSPMEVVLYRNRLTHDAPLIKQGLIVREKARLYEPIRPTSRALRMIFGISTDGSEIPGAVFVPVNRGPTDKPLLDQLVCNPFIKRQLKQIASWPGLNSQLARWKIHVEHGPIVLFSGPSGTGKTMAARAVAECAGLPLYRVDMGMLVSKYIGDTPKNINRLFDQAVRDDAILLFDEADGLLGKRGKVEDAHDRYANMEVGHLLSRIEQHPGICLLTSNLKEQIDTAFFRRIDVVLQFNPASVEQRILLWKKYLGEMLSDEGNLPEELATKPSLSAAQISSACRYAARIVADTNLDANGRPSRKQLLKGLAEGVWCELRKQSNGALLSSLGFLEQHLVTEAS